jgi:hypothetical protein
MQRVLRDRATRYLAMAIVAHERGHIDLAEALTERAARLMEEADAAEVGQTILGQSGAGQPNVQQQQQLQPKVDDEWSA